MKEFIRDSFGGRLIYHLSKHKYFKYPEEEEDYVIPDKYLKDINLQSAVIKFLIILVFKSCLII